MKRALPPMVLVAVVSGASPVAAQPRAPAPPAFPALPSPDARPQATPSSDAPPAPAALPTPQQLYERIRRGVALIERGGVPVAMGTLLGSDGRVLTALSGLGGAEAADIRYADGTTVHAKLGHSDRATDLALLVPQSGKWTDGLRASEADPSGTDLRAMLPSRTGQVGPAEAGVKGRVDAHARDGEPLAQMLDVDVKGPLVAGTPLLDSTGNVVAVLVRACKGALEPAAADSSPWAWANQALGGKAAATPCTPAVFGAPVSAIRSFLARTPATAAVPAPWLGIRGEADASQAARGVRITAVAPQSPAEKAGLKSGSDIIVAADGQPIDTPERLADAIAKHAPGEAVKLLVFSQDKFRDVTVALRAAP